MAKSNKIIVKNKSEKWKINNEKRAYTKRYKKTRKILIKRNENLKKIQEKTTKFKSFFREKRKIDKLIKEQ